MKNNNDQDDFFDIDIHRLHEEWQEQPRRFRKYATKLAHARKKFEKAKAVRDVVEAELDREIRTDPQSHGIDKITESCVAKAIVLNKRYQNANSDVIDCKHEMDILQAAVDALDHRKKALENEVSLRLADYFADPTVRDGKTREKWNSNRSDNAFRAKK